MNKNFKRTLAVLLFTAFSVHHSTAQTSAEAPAERPVPQIRFNLGEGGETFVKFNMLNQTWLRFNQSNPGTLVNGEPTDNTFDIGLRRTRVQATAKIDPRVLIYMQFGMNNFNALSQNAGNRKLQPFFHDALCQFTAIQGDNYLDIGGGLTIMNGLSRFTQPGISSIMSLDVPVFAQATVDHIDQFNRKLSVYAAGQAGPLHYRLMFTNPFPITTSSAGGGLGPDARYNPRGTAYQYQGFFQWNFFDKEYSVAPGYYAGTYLGKKKVLNIEAGAIYQPKATWSKANFLADTAYHNMLLFSAAIYADMPLNKEKGSAFNAYLGYFNTNYGPDYLRYNGLMNPANGRQLGTFGSGGNSYPMFGTGQVIYGQFGYLLPERKFMPYVTAQYATYEALEDDVLVLDAGINYFYRAHNCKFTLDYQNRPIFEGPDGTSAGRRSALIFQFQVFI